MVMEVPGSESSAPAPESVQLEATWDTPRPSPSAPAADNGWDTPAGKTSTAAPEPVQEPYQRQDIKNELARTGDLDTAMRVSQGNLKWALSVTRGIDPDTYAKARRVSEKTALPLGMVNDNLSTAEEMAQANDLTALITERDKDGKFRYPNALAWLQDKNNMALAKDDVQALATIERSIKANQEEQEGTLKQTVRALGAGTVSAGQGAIDAYTYLYGSLSTLEKKALPYFPFSGTEAQRETLAKSREKDVQFLLDNPVRKALENLHETLRPLELDKSAIDLAMSGEIQKAGYNIYLQSIYNAPQLVGMALATAAGAPELATLGGIGAITAGQSYTEGLAKGKTPEQAAVYATTAGIAEGVFEKVTLGNMKGVGKRMVESLGKDKASKVAWEIGKNLVLKGGEEGASEFATQVAQDFADYMTGEESLTVTQGMKNAINAFFVGFATGGVMEGAGGLAHARVKQAAFKRESQRQGQLEAAAENSKVRERAPEAFEQYLDTQLKDAGTDKVYLSADVLFQFHEKDPKKVLEVAKELGVEDQLKDADASGVELEINRAKWITKYAGTELAKAVGPELRYSVNGMSAAEEKKAAEEAKAHILEMQGQLEQLALENKLPEPIKILREKLMATKEQGGMGYSASDADAYSTLLLARYARLYGTDKAGMDKALGQIALQVGGEAVLSPNERTQDRPKKEANGEENLALPEEGDISFPPPEEIPLVLGKYDSEAMGRIMGDIEAAEPGGRIFIDNPMGPGQEVKGKASTVPEYAKELGIDGPRGGKSRVSLTEAKEAVKKVEYGKEAELTEREKKIIEELYTRSGYGKNLKPGDPLFQVPGWHGSGKDFERFAMQMIGTGEGAQAYGWGLYFAGNRNIAEWYRKRLTERNTIEFEGQEYTRESYFNTIKEKIAEVDPEGAVTATHNFEYFLASNTYYDAAVIAGKNLNEKGKEVLKYIAEGTGSIVGRVEKRQFVPSVKGGLATYNKMDKDERTGFFELQGRLSWFNTKTVSAEGALQKVREELVSGVERNREVLANPEKHDEESVRYAKYRGPEMEAALSILNKYGVTAKEAKPPGQLYRVELTPNEDEFLDWDKPLVEQSPRVMSALQSMPELAQLFPQNPAEVAEGLAKRKAIFDEYQKRIDETYAEIDAAIALSDREERIKRLNVLRPKLDALSMERDTKADALFVVKARNASGANAYSELAESLKFTREQKKALAEYEEKEKALREVRRTMDNEAVKAGRINRAALDNGFFSDYLRSQGDPRIAGKYRENTVRVFGEANVAKYDALHAEAKAMWNVVNSFGGFDGGRGTQYEAASKALLAAGVPGIRYKDATARGTEKESYNYVVFDDSLVKIEEKIYQEGQDAPLGSFQVEDAKKIISLFESANRSTLLHEFGHLFVNDMERLVASGAASEQIKTDLETLKAFADTSTVAGQEKLARAFESYLREGKAPSVKLVDAFRRFSAWLMGIYKAVTGLNVTVTPEVKAVFDRMLASEAEIKEAESYYKSKQELEALLPKATPKQKAKLQKTKEDAHAASLERKVKTALKAFFDATGGEKAQREFADREISARPEYEALDAMTLAGGISEKDLVDTYGKPGVDIIKEKHPGLVKKAGVTSLEEHAEKIGSPEALFTALVEADPKAVATEKRTQELINQREFEIRQSLEGQETVPAEEAFHNEEQLSYLIAQLEILQKQVEKAGNTRERTIEARVFKDAAREILDAKSAREASIYSRFSQAEQKYANQALAAMEKGDYVAAHEAKKRQVLNHALVLLSVEYRAERDKIEKAYQTKKLSKSLDSVENSYAELVKDLTIGFGLNTEIKPPKDVPKLEDLDETLAGLTPDWILNKQLPPGFKGWKDLSMAQLRQVHETIQSILQAGKHELASMDEEGLKTVKDFVAASTSKMEALPDARIFNEAKKVDKALEKLDGLLNDTLMTEFVSEHMDNFQFTRSKEFGPMRQLFGKVSEASAKEFALKADTVEMATPHLKALHGAVARIEKERGKYFQLKGLPITEDMTKLGRNNWTAERLIAILLNSGNEGNRNALKNAYGFDDSHFQVVSSLFTAEELKAIQGIWDVTDTLFPALDAEHFKLYNRHLVKVQTSPSTLVSSSGEVVQLRGGYYPLIFDHAMNDVVAKRNEEKELKDVLNNKSSAVFRKTKPEDGFTMSRVPGHSLPPELSMNVWFDHIADTAHYITHASVLKDLHRITLDADWRSSVRQKLGRDAYRSFRDWVTAQVAPQSPVKNYWERFLEHQRTLGSAAALGLRISPAIKQFLTLYNGATEIGWSGIIDGFASAYRGKGFFGSTKSESWARVEKLSDYMRQRNSGFDDTIRASKDKLSPNINRFEVAGKSFTRQDLATFAFSWMQFTDRTAVMPIWYGAFNQEMARSSALPEAERQAKAVKYADAIVRTSQASSATPDLNALMRSKGWLRLFTMFMTESFKYGNRAVGKYQAYKAGALSRADFFRYIVYENLLAPVTQTAIMGLVGWKEPEWQDWAFAPVENSLQWLPIIREVPRAMRSKYGQNTVGSTPAFEGFNRAIKAATSTYGWIENDKDFEKALWDVGRAVEFQLGVPATNVYRDTKRYYDAITGEGKK